MASLVKNYDKLNFILASASPRRSDLLRNIGMQFKVVISDVTEDEIVNGDIDNTLINNARKKGNTVAARNPDSIVISADTVVILDDHIMGKPNNSTEAFQMLQKLNGRIHVVKTAFGLILNRYHKMYFDTVATRVKFRQLDNQEIEAYVQSGEPSDKAGAYGIQGKGSLLIDSIDGCYFNIVGFPISKFFVALKKFCEDIQ